MDQWGHQGHRGWTAADGAAVPLRVPKTGELVADHFREQIVSGALIEGEYLPSEGVLTDEIGISRPTLREALRVLEAEGIAVTRGARTGARVLRPTVAPVARHAAMVLRANGVCAADLYAARLSVEPEAVALLCAARDPVALASLRDGLGAMQAAQDEGADDIMFARMNGFHTQLVAATGNRALALLADVLRHLMAGQQRAIAARRTANHGQHRKHLATALRSCSKLLRLIEVGDAAAAVAHWRAHLTTANALWLVGGEGERVVELPPAR